MCSMVLYSLCSLHAAGQDDRVYAVDTPETPTRGGLYVGNREPLLPSPLLKLPIGAITPQGWLRHMLELEADGLTGHLPEISRWCKAEDNAWLSPEGKGHSPWEELPYWLKGYGDLGYVLKDEKIINQARTWIEAMLASQEPDGYFGPRANRDKDTGPDVWPNMIALNCLQSYHEATGDERVLPFMSRYFRWQLGLPKESLLFPPPFWQRMRAGDNLESIYWLYNRTGEAWLLDLATKIHENTAEWTEGIASWHGVNISQCFRQPAEYYMQARDPKFLQAAERNYKTVMDRYGQVPGGMFGADENCREGYYGPRQAAETCSMVEFMHSFQMLAKITGNPLWADRCEEVAFNSFPASQPPDLKGLHYLTAPNMVQLDRQNKSPGLQNRGCMLAYDPHSYRCCQHNISHGWPYYAEELWHATPNNGLCASLYAASEVEAKVGDGTTVRITEETDYPFRDTVELTLAAPQPVRFPLHLRIPRWCDAPKVSINGQPVNVAARPLSYLVVERLWRDGDKVILQLPMQTAVKVWERNQNSVSVSRGPLTYSLKIGERWERYAGTDDWPAYEVYPTTPWNYGLEVDADDPAGSLQLELKPGPLPDQPFTVETAPVEMRARARKIPGWQMEGGLVGRLQMSPAKSTEPIETVTLIPMGCARLRISAFPTVSTAPDAHEWTAPPPPPLASHCNPGDTVTALNDGILPRSSGDVRIPRMTWWDHRGTKEWVAYRFEAARTLSHAEVYWFDDTGRGSCRIPASWQLLWRDGDAWRPVEATSPYGTELDEFNRVTFGPVTTSEIRLEVQLQPGFSGGILEWRVGE
ncbi:MAG: beta-L-arabinofuranosidase domain-containing protein [Armatimonadota bacterium]